MVPVSYLWKLLEKFIDEKDERIKDVPKQDSSESDEETDHNGGAGLSDLIGRLL
jgi:hypothetical protein